MSESNEATIDVRNLYTIALRRKWLLVIPILLVTAVAIGATYFLTPVYQSSTIIWIDKPTNVSRELINIIGSESSQRVSSEDRRRQLSALQNELTSKAYLTQLIADLNLADDPDIATEAAEMRADNPQRTLEQLKEHLLLTKLRDNIGVSFVGADQIEITANSANPALARDMVSRLAAILEREKSAYELEKILDNQTFADLQLEKTEQEYQAAVDSLTAAQERLAAVRLPDNISSAANRREILADIDGTKLDLDEYKADVQAAARRLDNAGLGGLTLSWGDSLLELRDQIGSQLYTYASMMERHTWNEQVVVNLNIKLMDNQSFFERELAREINYQFRDRTSGERDLLVEALVGQVHLNFLTARTEALEAAMGGIDRRVAAIPRLAAEIEELERRVSEARRYRDAFRSEEATVEILSERAKDRTKYKTIEPAQVPLDPVWPERKKIAVMGFLLGLVIGGGAAFLAEMFDRSFRSIEDVEQTLDLPVMAAVPKIENLKVGR